MYVAIWYPYVAIWYPYVAIWYPYVTIWYPYVAIWYPYVSILVGIERYRYPSNGIDTVSLPFNDDKMIVIVISL